MDALSTIELWLDRDSICMGDDADSHRYSLRVPPDMTLQQLLKETYRRVPGGTWVFHPANALHHSLAVVAPGRVVFCQPPDRRVADLGATELYWTYTERQDLDETLAVLKVGGRPGRAETPPLSALRDGVYHRLCELADQLGRWKAKRAAAVAKNLISDDPDLSALRRFAVKLAPSPQAELIRAWALRYDDDLVRRTFRCGSILYSYGYYDRRRALETRVAQHLPAPEEGWKDAPVYLGTDLEALAKLPIRDARFAVDLDAIKRRLEP